MAHIPDGLLSAPVLIAGAVIAAGTVGLALRRIDERAIPRVAVIASVFFAASLVSIPVGPSSVHMMFSGLMGVMLGVGVFPAVAVALLLQVVLFGFGGLTTLGINTVNIALPGALAGLALGPAIRDARRPGTASAFGALAGALPVLATGGLVALSLWLSSSDYVPAARVLLVTCLPLALAEAAVTAAAVGFLARVQPQALRPRVAALRA